jgi:hypothetical protein
MADQAALGLPFERKRVFSRAMMHLPWRMFVGRQVEYNRAAAGEIAALRKAVRRLRADLESQHVSGVAALREQIYRTEGQLRRDVSDLQIEVARLTAQERRS